MQFLLSVHTNTETFGEFGPYSSKEEMELAFADTGTFNEMLQSNGQLLFAGGLQDPSTAVVVDGQGGRSEGTHLGLPDDISGMWIIEAPDMDAAVALAEQGSKACRGKVEVRPFHQV